MAQNYTVLARTWRPKCFEDIVGQEVLVTTLKNAFHSGRIAHAFMLTGIRGVGKTTTARIIARALNYQPHNEATPQEGDARFEMPEMGVHCEAILNASHMDVVELDAASNTSIENVRALIDTIPYLPTLARYKVFIIDEVHMLSKSAFNGLLKTIEEPPAHVKFIFATTDIHKIPLTILSRCQRFDLRRLSISDIVPLLKRILNQENIDAHEDALSILAQASEGSARDALSLLDRVIVYALDNTQRTLTITREHVIQSLGLASDPVFFHVIEALFRGDAKAILNILDQAYQEGLNPLLFVRDLLDMVNILMRTLKGVPHDALPLSLMARQDSIERLGKNITTSQLSRLWQLLLKAFEEVSCAPNPQQALEMALIRIAYFATLPPLEQLITSAPFSDKGDAIDEKDTRRLDAQTQSDKAQLSPLPSQVKFTSIEDVLEHLQQYPDKETLRRQIESCARIAHFETGSILFEATKTTPHTFLSELKEFLEDVTKTSWYLGFLENTERTTHTENGEAQAPHQTVFEKKKKEKERALEMLRQKEPFKTLLETHKSSTIEIIDNEKMPAITPQNKGSSHA